MGLPRTKKEAQVLREEILRTQLEIQEHSLKLIRKEMYDSIGQVLIFTKLNIHSATSMEQAKARKVIDESEKLIAKVIKHLRLASNPVTSKEIAGNGFIYALKKEVETINRMTTCKLVLTQNENFPRLDVPKELILFRITQELLSVALDASVQQEVLINAGYSDHVARISITLFCNNEPLSYCDDITTALASCAEKLNFRARLVCARITHTHQPAEDFTILIELPVLQ